MSCEYCEDNRDMKGPSEGTGDDIEEICISQLSYFSGGSLEKVEHRIFVELSEGDAFTLSIRFCPMCGERLSCGKDER